MLRLRRTSLTALLLVAVTVLAACGAQDPRPAPPRPSSTPTPSPTAPTMPALARQKTDAGAKAFVRFYLAAMNHATMSGDTSLIHQWSTRRCMSCVNFAKQIDSVYAAGGSIRGGQLRIVRLRVLAPGEHQSLLAAWVRYGRQVLRISASSKPKMLAAGSNILNVRLTGNAAGWAVQELTPAQS